MDPAAKYTPTPPATRITTNPTTTWRTPNRTTTARHDRTNQPKRSPLTTTQCPADAHPFGTPRHKRPTREPASTQDKTVPKACTELHISRTRPGAGDSPFARLQSLFERSVELMRANGHANCLVTLGKRCDFGNDPWALRVLIPRPPPCKRLGRPRERASQRIDIACDLR